LAWCQLDLCSFWFLHGCYFIPLILKGTMNKKIRFQKINFFLLLRFFQYVIAVFTGYVNLYYFRSATIGDAFGYYQILFSKSLFHFQSKQA